MGGLNSNTVILHANYVIINFGESREIAFNPTRLIVRT